MVQVQEGCKLVALLPLVWREIGMVWGCYFTLALCHHNVQWDELVHGFVRWHRYLSTWVYMAFWGCCNVYPRMSRWHFDTGSSSIGKTVFVNRFPPYIHRSLVASCKPKKRCVCTMLWDHKPTYHKAFCNVKISPLPHFHQAANPPECTMVQNSCLHML